MKKDIISLVKSIAIDNYKLEQSNKKLREANYILSHSINRLIKINQKLAIKNIELREELTILKKESKNNE